MKQRILLDTVLTLTTSLTKPDETSVAREEVGSSALDVDYLSLVLIVPPQNTDFEHGDERRLYVLLSSSTFA